MAEWVEIQPKEYPAELADLVGGHPLVVQALMRRGITDQAAAQGFLDPEFYTPADPRELPGLEQAAALVLQAVQAEKKVLVWGDFDVDGQTSTTVLVSALRSLQGRVAYHIPVRQFESHGVLPAVLEQILDRDPAIGLVLTCDTGISAHAAVEMAGRRGVEMVITDHHTLPEQLPPASAIVNPRCLPSGHPLSTLPGVGVAYMLALELHRRGGDLVAAREYLDLVALGIVADLAELRGDTRYLLQLGLRQLRDSGRRGLQIMLQLAGLDQALLSEEHIGFMLAPRLNAVGRLGDANPVVELLTSDDEVQVRLIAEQIESFNARRQLLTSQVMRAALKQVQDQPALLAEPVLLLSHPSWPAGVIGIVASRLVERFNKPAVLISAPPGQPARASARSVPGIDISAVLAGCADLLLSHGGHAMAAGFSLHQENIPALGRKLNSLVKPQVDLPEAALMLDGYLPLRQLTFDLVKDLERLAPFGSGNPPVLLASRRMRLTGSMPVGRQQEHLQVTIEDEDGDSFRLIWWQAADFAGQDQLPKTLFDLAYTARTTSQRGPQELQIEWVEARPSEQVAAVNLRPSAHIVDYRQSFDPLPVLLRLASQPGMQVWMEGTQRDGLRRAVGPSLSAIFRGRAELERGEILVIWTAPPGQYELQQALQRVRPYEVILFGLPPPEAAYQPFLERLAGLAKYALQRMEGRVALAELAAAAAARIGTVSMGLRVLHAHGQISILDMETEFARLAAGDGQIDPAAGELSLEFRHLLQETSAYHQFFSQADASALGLDSV